MTLSVFHILFTLSFLLTSVLGLAQAGSIDPTFDIGNGANDRIRSISLQPDGRIIIAGDFTQYDFAGYSRLARLLPDGGFDISFFTTSANQAIYTTKLQPDGKVLLGGVFSSYQAPRMRIARVNDEADLDQSFVVGSGASGIVRDFAVLPDGKILVAGNLVTYNDTTVNRIVKLNNNGSIDLTFNSGTGFNGNTHVLAVQPDGKIVIGGFFINYNGVGASRITRLNPDGTKDDTFDPGSGGNSTVRRVVLQPDGKIVIAGAFDIFNGSTVNYIARLNSDGSLDDSFETGTGAGDGIYAMALQPDGKILIGGDFTTFNGTAVNRIARLNPDGSLDDSFDVGSGPNQRVEDIVIQPDGKVLVGGHFTLFNGNAHNRLVRLLGDAIDCNGDEDGTAYFDQCGDCVGGNTGLEPCEADCNGDFGGTAFLDECDTCVGGNTGLEPCEEDCNGDFGGTAFIDECDTCVSGDTGLEPCEADCNGVFGGTAYLDECDTCVGGDTGLEPCEEDCNGDFGGTAYLDECDTCVGGNTGLEPCEADCHGDFGGTAYLDDCDICVGGNTGLEPCVEDCHGDFGGTAYLDECDTCVGGNTGLEPCEADCHGDFGGTAFLDECDTCVGGNTGLEPCEEDCNGDFGGTAFIDECGTCVGGDTGLEPCYGGCINVEACNYDPSAGFDDGSCLFVGDACDDGNPDTENDVIQEDCECEGEVIIGINENESAHLVFPNPATTVLTIVTGDNTLLSHARIMDTNGKTLITETFTESAVIDVATLASGIYILVIENNSGQSRSKIVIAR